MKKTINTYDLPREKLKNRGVSYLKDEELLAIMLCTGYKGKHVLSLASDIFKTYPKEKFLTLTLDELASIKGIGKTKASILMAGFELARRVMSSSKNITPTIHSSRDIYSLVIDIQQMKKEYFVALYLNARNQLIKKEVVSIGTINQSLVHPREVFYPAIKNLACSVAFAHNHPSHDPFPSQEDILLTKRLVNAGKILGITVLDHVIVCKDSIYSFKDNKLI